MLMYLDSGQFPTELWCNMIIKLFDKASLLSLCKLNVVMAHYGPVQHIANHTVQEAISSLVKLVIIVIGINIMSDIHLIMKYIDQN